MVQVVPEGMTVHNRWHVQQWSSTTPNRLCRWNNDWRLSHFTLRPSLLCLH